MSIHSVSRIRKASVGAVASAAFALAMGFGAAAQADTISATLVWTGGGAGPYQEPAMEAFIRHVETATGGEIQIESNTIEALGGDDRNLIDQVRLGEVEITLYASTGGLSGVFPDVQLWNWPFMFPNRIVAWTLFQDPEYRAAVDRQMQEASGGDLRWLGAAENSIRNLYSTHGPIRTPSDLAEFGTKIRTMQVPMHQEIFAAMGAGAVVALPAAERYTAKQTGMIDATEGGLMSAWNAGLLEVSDYVTLTGHMYDFHHYVANGPWFEGLSDEHQGVIRDAAIIASRVQNVHALETDSEALELIRDDGNTIYEPTADEIRQWQEAAEPIAQRYIEEMVDGEFIDITRSKIDQIVEAYQNEW